jgi:hypothetical protein
LEVPSPWHADKAFAGNLKEVHEVCVNLLVILALFHIRVHYFVFGGTTHPKTHAAACASRCEITLVSHTETEKRDAAGQTPPKPGVVKSEAEVLLAAPLGRTTGVSMQDQDAPPSPLMRRGALRGLGVAGLSLMS